MSQYLDLFMQEAGEQLEILEQETLELEADPSIERLQVIFRAAHTLKGSSRAMGFSSMAELTHEMENVLDQLRNQHLQLDNSITDALLECQDTLKQMVESIASGQGDKVECTELLTRVRTIAENTSEPESASAPNTEDDGFKSQIPPSSLDALKDAAAQAPVYHAQFRLSADCVLKYVRAFMAINLIQEQGEILVAVPEHEALEEERFEHEFELLFQTPVDIEELTKSLASLTEIEWLRVKQWQPGEKDLSSQSTDVQGPHHEGATSQAASSVAASPTSTKKLESGQTVRVDVTRLDNLMNLVGELVIDRTRLAQIGSEMAAQRNVGSHDALAETVSHIARITSELQDQIMKARMMPIETVFNRFPRVVRDLAQKLGKEIKLNLVGGETELDRSVIEVIGDPLLHIIRNCIDHGIEMPERRAAVSKPSLGNVTVSARHQESHIVIEIFDDGAGIDVQRVKDKAHASGLVTLDQAARMSDKEALQLIFASGLSTAEELSEVSGRGVGMDIVRSNIQRLGGVVDIETEIGKGTKFTLKLPLTLAIIRGLLVSVNSNVYVLPLTTVVETLLISRNDIQTVNKCDVIVIRGQTMPLVKLPALFATGVQDEPTDSVYVVVVGLAERRIGVVVDRLIGEQEVVIKSLSRFCGDVAGVSGATILGNGNVALIVDVNGIVPEQQLEKSWH